MDINRNNYEAYFLDFFEGTLSPEDEKALFAFLEENPDMATVFEDAESDKLISDSAITMRGFDKDLLRLPDLSFQEVNDANVDHALIAEIEGLLSEKQKESLTAFRAVNNEAQKSAVAYSMTTQIPDTSVVFPEKNLLKRSVVKPINPIYYYVSVAASIVLILGFYFLFSGEKMGQGNTFSNRSNANKPDRSIHIPIVIEDRIENSTGNNSLAVNEENQVDKRNSQKVNSGNSLPILTTNQDGTNDLLAMQQIPITKAAYIPSEQPSVVQYRKSPVPITTESEEGMNVKEYVFHKAASIFAPQHGTTSREKSSDLGSVAAWTLRAYGKLFRKDVAITESEDMGPGTIQVSKGNIAITSARRY
ncbi:MAG: hypothetical protein KKA07_00780 [Bacteroidetes bacterium]|nr:hypothetical protein [Bacteroidota bacterium]MBU1717584.1 hypothetical protein [Bacteroidota bacterium]